MLGLWTATDFVLETVRAEVGADFAVNTLHDAATIILAEASGSKSVRDETKPVSAMAEPPSVIPQPSVVVDPGLFGA